MSDETIDRNNDFVLFGAMGDLAQRKLLPALYQLERAHLLPDGIHIVAIAKDTLDRSRFQQQVKASLKRFVPSLEYDKDAEQSLLARLQYLSADFTRAEDYTALAEYLTQRNRAAAYYLATPPALYGTICNHLRSAGAISPASRIVLEKPIGHDLASSQLINDLVGEFFEEQQIYRIDHYLGKETVQNLIALRFANNLFGTQWNQNFIDHVQITVAETVGLEGRWSYYDKVGQLRDMLQNHVLQLLCMVAMDPPSQLTADGVRDEKIKVLRALRPITQENLKDSAVRAQYTAGAIQGQSCPGYLEEEGGNGKSHTETFVALKVHVDSWRWAGVPFYIRTGKRMATKATEIVISFRNQPHYIFDPKQRNNVSNRLIIRLQPDEGIKLNIVTKAHCMEQGMALQNRQLSLDLTEPGARIVDAYERLLLEFLRGNQALFVRRDEVEASWRWCDELTAAWAQQAEPLKHYPAGSWGPTASVAMIERDGRSWHE